MSFGQKKPSFRAVIPILVRLEVALAAALLLLMVGLIFLGGVARMLHHPLNWTVDLATCSFAWACFLSADVAWRRDALMTIDLVSSRFSQTKRFLRYANHVIITLFLIYLIYSGIYLSIVSHSRSFQGIPAVSYSWVTMSLPVGGTLLLITTLMKIRRMTRFGKPDDGASTC